TTPLSIIKRDGSVKAIQIKQLFVFEGLGRKETDCVKCGDLCAIVGIENIDISDTITDPEHQDRLPLIAIDEPTISMLFRVNDSPFYGREGKYVSSRHLRERLFKEIEKDVALHVEESGGDAFKVSGRGVLHLAILIENMRREGYEMGVAKPQVIYKTIDGVKLEPLEALSVDVPSAFAGKIIELVGVRKGEMTNMEARGERQLIEFKIPTRGLIGLRSKALTLSAGEAIVSHRFLKYAPFKGEIPHRLVGSLVSMGQGPAAAYAIDALQQRGIFFIPPNTETYEGMVVGEHSRDGELMVNLQKTKNLTNVRSSGTDRNLKIAPHVEMSLEQALEYIEDDELVELTPESIRLRKIHLSALDRKRNKSK
ncbi:MAG: translational GTPase TypA, partial [Victivallaceae bacterium]|nr:translational GTPase TypA [Victivallaceae bacterium]